MSVIAISAKLSSVLKKGQPCFYWEDGRLFEEPTAFLSDEYCQTGSRSSPRTWATVRSELLVWLNWCCETGLDWRRASRDHLIDFREVLEFAVSPVTHQTYGDSSTASKLETVIRFYRYAKKRGWCFTDLIGSNSRERTGSIVPRRRAKRNAIRAFAPQSLRKLLAQLGPEPSECSANTSRDRLIADWGWAVGLRLTEIVDLDVHQFHANHNELSDPYSFQPVEVLGKGRIRRNVAVPNWLMSETQKYIGGERAHAIRAGRVREPNAVFVSGLASRFPGHPISAKRVQKVIETACLASQLTRQKQRVDPETSLETYCTVAAHSAHDLRHTYAIYTYWVEQRNGNAEPWKLIQAQLGHANLATTIRTYLSSVQLFGPSGLEDVRSMVGLPRHV